MSRALSPRRLGAIAELRRKWQRGKFTDRREPIWEPLLEVLPEDIDDFMWMGEVALTDGTQIQLYKHYWRRRYLCLDLGGRTFINPGKDRWEEAEDAEWMVELVFRFGETRGDIVRRNEWIDGDRISWARSATKHRISRQRSLHVVRHAGICFREGDADGWYDEPRFVFLGPDAEACPLEVVAVAPEDGSLVIIHAMSLRERWQAWYWEGLQWRK